MTILLISPGQQPKKATIDDTLAAMQRTVGGSIQAVYPFQDPVALICHEEGKLLHLPLNRSLRSPDTGEIYDIIAGDFFLCAAPPDSERFESLTNNQLERYARVFRTPEMFLSSPDGSIIVLPLPGVSIFSSDETVLPQNLSASSADYP